MAFTTLSTVSAYEEEKCLVRSGKDIVRSGKGSMWRYLAKYVEILGKICGDTWQFISTYWKWGLNRFVMPYEMRVCFLSVIGGILESFVGESFQFFRR